MKKKIVVYLNIVRENRKIYSKYYDNNFKMIICIVHFFSLFKNITMNKCPQTWPIYSYLYD